MTEPTTMTTLTHDQKEPKETKEPLVPNKPKKSKRPKKSKKSKKPKSPKKSEESKQFKESEGPKESEQSQEPKQSKESEQSQEPKQSKESEQSKEPKQRKMLEECEIVKRREGLISLFFEVGPSAILYYVSPESLYFHSPFIRAHISTHGSQAHHHHILLHEFSNQVFTLLMNWSYKFTITLTTHKSDDDTTAAAIDFRAPHNQHGPLWQQHALECGKQDKVLVQLWLLAEKLEMTLLQNAVIDEMVRIFQICGVWSPGVCEIVYAETKRGSPLRRLAVAQWLENGWYVELSEMEGEDLPSAMMFDMLRCLKERMNMMGLGGVAGGKDVWVSAPNYYVH